MASSSGSTNVGLTTVRLKSAARVGGMEDHDVDAVALELDEAGELVDFRLELGRAFEIVWVLPAGPGERLRAILVDSAVAHVEPELRRDPCLVTFGPEEWSGELARVGPGGARVLEHVHVAITPAGYTCRARVREPDGTMTTRTVRG